LQLSLEFLALLYLLSPDSFLLPSQVTTEATRPAIQASSRPQERIPAPRTIEETGIRRKVLEDLALKTLHLSGELTLRDLAERMHVSLWIVDEIFGRLRKESLCQVTGMAAGVHRISRRPRQGSRDRAPATTQYAGPLLCPSPTTSRVKAQTVRISGGSSGVSEPLRTVSRIER
jgi:hypothetical protein